MSRRGTPGDSDGRKRGQDEVGEEETGWLDDLRDAKQSADRLGRDDFSGGGSDRWSKLSALSSDGGDSPPARESSGRAGRRAAPEPAPPPPPSSTGRRAAPDPAPTSGASAGGRRRAEEPDASSMIGRRAARQEPDTSSLIGRRAARQEPDASSLIGRRARQDPETETTRRGRQDLETETTRRGRHDSEPETSRRGRQDPETETTRRGRQDPEPETSRRGRHDSEPETSRRGRHDPEPTSGAAPSGRRRAEEPDASSLIGRRAARQEPDASSLIGRRARQDPETETTRRGRHDSEPDSGSLIGRRSRQDPDSPTGRRATGPTDQEPPAVGRRSRPDDDPNSATSEQPRRRLTDIFSRQGPPAPGATRPAPGSPAGPVPGSPAGPMPSMPPRQGGGAAPAGPPSPGGEQRRGLFGGGRGSTPPPAGGAVPPAAAPEDSRRRRFFGDRAQEGPPPSAPPPPVGGLPPTNTPEEARRRKFFGGERPSPQPGPPHPISPAHPISPGRPAGGPQPLSPMPSDIGRPRSPMPADRPVRASSPEKPGGGVGVIGAGGPPGPGLPSPGPGGLGGPRVRLAASVEAIRGARSEVRKQLREQQRLRMWTLVAIVVLVVGALPFWFVLRAATRDPVLTSLDALSVPSWAVTSKDDNIGGSRWCLLDCRYRERTVNSSHAVEETAKVYQDALRSAGWTVITGVPGCPPEPVEGEHESCWRRDEFTLDLWVREPPACSEDPLNKRPTVAPPTGTPSAEPSAGASEPPVPGPAGPVPNDVCAGSTVTMKVRNAIADERLQYAPESTPTPGLDELTDEDLNPSGAPTTPTPSPS